MPCVCVRIPTSSACTTTFKSLLINLRSSAPGPAFSRAFFYFVPGVLLCRAQQMRQFEATPASSRRGPRRMLLLAFTGAAACYPQLKKAFESAVGSYMCTGRKRAGKLPHICRISRCGLNSREAVWQTNHKREPPGSRSTRLAMAAVRFHSPREAQANFSRIARRVPASLLAPLPLLLAESPNPDAALNLFERLVYPESLDVIRSLERHPQLLHYALALFANSQYLGETLIQNPDLLPGLLREDSLGRVAIGRRLCRRLRPLPLHVLSRHDTSLLLARFKRREYVRIVLRDILGIATLAEITAEISALTDVLIEEALRICESNLRKRYGTPQHYDAENRLVPNPLSACSRSANWAAMS